MDWLDLLAVQETLKSLLQHHSSKASILWCSAFFIVQFSHPYMTARKTIALMRQTFVGKVMSLLFNMLSRLVITFLPRSKCLLIQNVLLPASYGLLIGSPHLVTWGPWQHTDSRGDSVPMDFRCLRVGHSVCTTSNHEEFLSFSGLSPWSCTRTPADCLVALLGLAKICRWPLFSPWTPSAS